MFKDLNNSSTIYFCFFFWGGGWGGIHINSKERIYFIKVVFLKFWHFSVSRNMQIDRTLFQELEHVISLNT